MSVSGSNSAPLASPGFNPWMGAVWPACRVLMSSNHSALASLNHDELEAVHTAWKTVQGEVIYADFFQHHHPLFYAWLAPVIMLSGERAATVVACRSPRCRFSPASSPQPGCWRWRPVRQADGSVAAACLLLRPFLYQATRSGLHVPLYSSCLVASPKRQGGGPRGRKIFTFSNPTHHAPPWHQIPSRRSVTNTESPALTLRRAGLPIGVRRRLVPVLHKAVF